jgi:hypothetical protein
MYRKANCLYAETRKTLSMILIQCHFDYSCSSWYTGISQALKNKLQVAQTKTVRFIKSMRPRTSIKQTELSSLGFLNVKNRVKQLRLNHDHKIFNNACPSYLKNNVINKLPNITNTIQDQVVLIMQSLKLKVSNQLQCKSGLELTT